MTCIVSPTKFPTKKALKLAIEAGEDVWIEDPSIFNPRVFESKEITPAEQVCVTNHPKRSWFAIIRRAGMGGKLLVK